MRSRTNKPIETTWIIKCVDECIEFGSADAKRDLHFKWTRNAFADQNKRWQWQNENKMKSSAEMKQQSNRDKKILFQFGCRWHWMGQNRYKKFMHLRMPSEIDECANQWNSKFIFSRTNLHRYSHSHRRHIFMIKLMIPFCTYDLNGSEWKLKWNQASKEQWKTEIYHFDFVSSNVQWLYLCKSKIITSFDGVIHGKRKWSKNKFGNFYTFDVISILNGQWTVNFTSFSLNFLADFSMLLLLIKKTIQNS